MSKEFLDIQAATECGFTLKRVRDMIRTYGPTVNWKLFSGHFIKAAMTAHVPSITKYACVAISDNFSLIVA